MNVRHAKIETRLGEITLVADGGVIVGLYFPHHWSMPARATFGPEVDASTDAVLVGAAVQLGEYLDGDRTEFDLPTATSGDGFQERVWAMLGEIPFGQTTTYGALAARLGDAVQAQAVGDAVGRNPLCVIVPCHRVVGSDGKLRGYAGGLHRKAALLELEQWSDRPTVRVFEPS